jgi:hypothetical protein
MQGVVHTLGVVDADNPRNHESVTRNAIARRLAALLGYRFGGEYVASRQRANHVYFVPPDTLVGFEDAARLGIRGEGDLFGAVVAHTFVATKAITHPALDGARTPDGWNADFAARVADAVLAGFSVFSRADAKRAAEQLLERGPVRVKLVRGIGGRGQWVARERGDLAVIVDALDEADLESFGVVVEEHLHDVQTLSVGRVRVGGLVVSYWGTQRLTPNNTGTEVYGGSELNLTRGDFAALLAQPLRDDVRVAVRQACVYDSASLDCYAPMFGSRRNYDVAQGVNGAGARCSGVLEQSWRIGGASGAEIAALEAFADDPDLTTVRASTVEVYGASDAPPADAMVYFREIDERVGPLTKYTTIERAHADTR